MSISIIYTTALGVFLTFYQYLFLKEMLGTKHRYAYLGFYLGTWLYGHINVWFYIAGTVWGNFIYLCVCAFALNTLLFHGSIIKKIFFILWMYGVQEVACSIFFPLFRAMAVLSGNDGDSDIILKAVDLLACLIAIVTMGILRRKLHLLKREFEDRDGIYLICMIVFICAAVSMMSTMIAGVYICSCPSRCFDCSWRGNPLRLSYCHVGAALSRKIGKTTLSDAEAAHGDLKRAIRSVCKDPT